MKIFDVDEFMLKVHREAEEPSIHVTYEVRNLLELLHLNGEEFIIAAYRKILLRDVDAEGLQAYLSYSYTLKGKIRIFNILYSSSEFSMCHAVNNKNIYRLHHSIRNIITWVYIGADFIKSILIPKKSRDLNINEFYFNFENKYRKDFTTIYEQMDVRYSKVLNMARSVGNNALDLGCGRGEMVALLADYGFSVIGIDNNPYTVSYARQRGLNVRLGDLRNYIRTLPNASQDFVSAFHVIEHVSFNEMWDLISQIRRILQPGGILILETPNIRNILVASSDFYRDPTHIQHVFPDTLDFLLNSYGFEGTAYFFTTEEQPIPFTDSSFNDLSDQINVSRDMAWIGCKLKEDI